MAPRAITQLFQEINSRPEIEFFVSCTYMEIYNERIYDLLIDVARPEQGSEYTIAEEKDGRGVIVRGLNEIEVRDEAAALNLLFTGGLSRTTATHKLNKRSNRSHSLFTLYLQQRQRSGVSERVVHSKLHLVDLAGSERLKKTMESADGSLGDEVTRKESMAINRSLTYLEQCVVALTRKGAGHVPYRQSKLTNILKDCLGANCNTVLVACIWGESSHLEETVSTLRLASRMMKVQNESVSVESVDPTILLKKQEKIIKALKQELLMHDALVERTGVVYDSYTPEQQAEVGQLIEKFVAAPEREEEGILEINTYRQMLEICKQFKKKLLEARSNASSAALGRMTMGSAGFHGDERAVTADAKGERNYPQVDFSSAKDVGQTVGGGKGFALGEAKQDSRPPGGIETSSSFYAASAKPMGVSTNQNNNHGSPGGYGAFPDSPMSRNNVMDNFLMQGNMDVQSIEVFLKQSEEGQVTYQDFTSMKVRQKDLKQKIRALTQEVNDAKMDIDNLNRDLEMKKTSRIQSNKKSAKDNEIVDEEEMRIVKTLKEAKQKYRNSFEQMQRQQGQMTALANEMDSTKIKLVDLWRTWQQLNASGRFADSPGRPGSSGGRFNNANSFGEFNAADELDDQEAFDKLEVERVMANDPDSMAFFSAQKTRKANLTQSGNTIRMIQRNKRYT